MLGTIIKKELLTNLLSLRIAICYGIIGLLVVFSITIRGLQYKQQAQVYRTDLEQYDEESKKNEKIWWTYNVRIPPRKLGIFYRGFDDVISRPFLIDIMHPQNRPLGDYALDSPVLRIYRAYDLLFITAFIISLLVIFIGYDTVAGERERGTFRLLLTNRVSKGTLIMGKLAGGILSVTVPYLAAVAAGLLILQLGLGIPFTLKEYALLAGFLAVCTLFIITVYLFTVLCSTACSTPQNALFTALVIWLVAAFGIPYFGVYGARTLKPVLTFGEYQTQVKESNARELAVAAEERKALVGKYTGRDFDWEETMVYRRAHMRMAEAWNQLRADHRGKLRAQAGLGMNLARLSPVGLLVNAGSRFTQTGLAARYHADEWKDGLYWANKAVFDHESHTLEKKNREREINGEKQVRLTELPFDTSNLPSRIYPGMGLKATLRGAQYDLLILCPGAVGIFLAAFLAFIRRQDT